MNNNAYRSSHINVVAYSEDNPHYTSILDPTEVSSVHQNFNGEPFIISTTM